MSVTANRRVQSALTTTNATPATGISATYKYRKRKGHDIVRYSLQAGTLPLTSGGGTITGAYKLEVSNPDAGVWVDVPDGEFTNTETSGTFVPGNDCDIRWNCTVADTDVVVTIG